MISRTPLTDHAQGAPTRVGIIGGGFMAAAHVDALRRIPNVEVSSIASRTAERAHVAASALGVRHVFEDWRSLVSSPEVDVVHNCTPTALHTEINLAAIRAGKHILCEKPLATSPAEARAVVTAAHEAGVVGGTCFNYRYYTAIQRLRGLLGSEDCGPTHLVHGGYLQDWLLKATDWNWRIDPDLSGPSLAFADIGTHWLDLVEYVTGDRMTEIFADLGTLHTIRREGLDSGVIRDHEVSGEDFGVLIGRTAAGVQISTVISQVSAGRKNRLHFEIDAANVSYGWDQEHPNQLQIGRRGRPNEVWERAPQEGSGFGANYPELPQGHPEGWVDALRRLCVDFHRAVREQMAGKPPSFTHPSLEDGLRALEVTMAALRSSTERAWVKIDHEIEVPL